MPASYVDNLPPPASKSPTYNFNVGGGKSVKSLDDISSLNNTQAQQLVNFSKGNEQAVAADPNLSKFFQAANARVQQTSGGSGSGGTAGQLNSTLANNVNGLVPTNKTPGVELNQGMDYLDRKAVVDQNKAIRKVSLVGNYGTGARPLTGDSRLAPSGTAISQAKEQRIVVFDSTPDLSESGSTVLIDIGDIRAAASVVIYMGSPSRTFSITARFISRDSDEADKTYENITNLKAWRMPMLAPGVGFNAEAETLRLFAYEDSLKGIPVMIQSLNIEWPSDIDYVYSDKYGTQIPIIQTASIQLKEVRSFDDLKTFDYAQFRNGSLNTW